jgi:hypothetical protein
MGCLMLALQWSGTILVMLSYWFYVTKPKAAIILSVGGCALAGLWAYLLTPTAWGVFALEVFVLTMGVRNLWKLQWTNKT